MFWLFDRQKNIIHQINADCISFKIASQLAKSGNEQVSFVLLQKLDAIPTPVFSGSFDECEEFLAQLFLALRIENGVTIEELVKRSQEAKSA